MIAENLQRRFDAFLGLANLERWQRQLGGTGGRNFDGTWGKCTQCQWGPPTSWVAPRALAEVFGTHYDGWAQEGIFLKSHLVYIRLYINIVHVVQKENTFLVSLITFPFLLCEQFSFRSRHSQTTPLLPSFSPLLIGIPR